jgi:hypothetical protein
MRRLLRADSISCAVGLIALACEARVPDRRPPETREPLTCEQTAPGRAPLRPLTRLQYDNTMADLLGDVSRPSQLLPPENEVSGYRNNADANPASPLLVEQYLAAAEGVAQRAVASRLAELAPCSDGTDQDECGRAFVRDFGLRAFRRPLDDSESGVFAELFSRTRAIKGYAKAVELVLSAMLQSPQFVYRVDALRAPTVETGAIPVTGYPMASRLSFFLLNSLPDTELLAAARDGQLETPAQVEAQARRLVAHPRTQLTVLDFHEQWLELGRLNGAIRQAPDVSVSPAALARGWQGSLQRFLTETFWRAGTVQSLFESAAVFVNADLAPLYGAEPPPDGFVQVESGGPRAGLLTQPALLALLAHSDQSAPVLRGAFIRDRILCLPVPPPPPDVNAVPPDPDPSATTRERFRQHTESDTCRNCHAQIDGIGFGLERYDQFGRYRAVENGFDVDESGEVFGTGDPELDGTFTGAEELARRLGQSSRVRDCVATQWYRYAMGRLEEEADRCSLDQVKSRFAESGGDLEELLVALTQTDAFLYRPAIGGEP